MGVEKVVSNSKSNEELMDCCVVKCSGLTAEVAKDMSLSDPSPPSSGRVSWSHGQEFWPAMNSSTVEATIIPANRTAVKDNWCIGADAFIAVWSRILT
ncbi:hypothetical protein BFJ66_g16061 [Fusarium oxysporum f. sp. cepae]|nr:hypothetical protein BFJ67_g15730 [Fusarium oxysporum f. sp. cepae]RKK30977.1 hypothetical protein BFJ66_g16061 [Fusarium oxysporum f. sp. cepae]